MTTIEERFPITSGIVQGTVIGITVSSLSPFSPIGTAFCTAAAVIVNMCLPQIERADVIRSAGRRLREFSKSKPQ